jgi:glycosyltransferase involved in cell wall biosynthesis
MRVLMVTLPLPTAERPGTWAPIASQIGALRSSGIDVDVLEVSGPPKLKYLAAIRRLHARGVSHDLVHANFGYCGWVARSQLRAPVVVSFLGSDLLGTASQEGKVTPWSRAVVAANRRLARLVDAVIVKSAQMARLVAPARAHVIPHGVDTHRFRPLELAEARARLGWHQDGRYVLFAGHPANPVKAFGVAAAAVERARARSTGAIELVPLTGIAPEEMPVHMSAADALILSSYWEGSPNVVKESMACNLPVVSVPVGDVPELLDGVEPAAIRAREPEALGGALAELLDAPRRSNGRHALQRKGLELEQASARVAAIYEEVLASTPRSATSRRS